MPNAKPILFNTDMVRAILDGRKSVTRRALKSPYYVDDEEASRYSGFAMHKGTGVTHGMPYEDAIYSPGDILWVRETWRPHAAWSGSYSGCEIEYKAGGENLIINGSTIAVPETVTPWRPSIHMPREAARIWLRVTDVRVERLQQMTVEESLREGVKLHLNGIANGDPPLKPFAHLWDSTIKPTDRDLYGWDANPFVWVIDFERCEKPEV